MLTIRLKRVGRSGHAQFRVIVQEHRFSPKSGKVAETIGSYNPHTKKATLDKDALKKHLDNGAQPSERMVKIFKAEKIDLPKWVVEPKERKKEPKKKSESDEAESAPADDSGDKKAEETKEEKSEASEKETAEEEPAPEKDAKEEDKETKD